MKKYIGTKIIQAKPESQNNIPGYAVVYPDGYRSWSPADVFEAAYREAEGMTFGLAIEAMKRGMRVKLPHWSKDVFISEQTPGEQSKMTAPYFFVTSRNGLVPWIPTFIEMMADSWELVLDVEPNGLEDEQ